MQLSCLVQIMIKEEFAYQLRKPARPEVYRVCRSVGIGQTPMDICRICHTHIGQIADVFKVTMLTECFSPTDCSPCTSNREKIMAEQSYSVRENRYDSSKPEDAEKPQQGAPAGNFALRRAHYFEGATGLYPRTRRQ